MSKKKQSDPKVENTEVKETVKPIEAKTETPKEEVKVKQIENVWVKDWQELVLVEGSKDDAIGRQYYGVKRES